MPVKLPIKYCAGCKARRAVTPILQSHTPHYRCLTCGRTWSKS